MALGAIALQIASGQADAPLLMAGLAMLRREVEPGDRVDAASVSATVEAL